MSSASTAHQRLIRKLESIATLGADDRAALMCLPLAPRAMAEDSDIINEGSQPSECTLLIEGFACRYKILPDGERQIFSFHIPGDILDIQSLHLNTMDHSIGALAPCQVATIPHQTLRELASAQPKIGSALWRDTLIDAAVFRAWLAGVGRKSAKQRIAHLFCEQLVRFRAVGLADERGMELPLTQAELADALGLSSVHVNRVLQELRTEGLVVTRGRFLGVLNWEGLVAVAEFDPVYLHLERMVS